MAESPTRWSLWPIGVAALFLVASVFAWWGTGVLSRGMVGGWPLVGIVGAAVCYSTLCAIAGTPKALRRIAILIAFASAVPFLFMTALPIGIAGSVVAAVVAELGATRVERLRRAFQQAPIIVLARSGTPFFFSAASILLTAAVFVSPIGAAFFSPVHAPALRAVIAFADPFVRPSLGFSLSDSLDQLIVHVSGLEDPRAIAALREQYGRLLGASLRGDEDIAEILSIVAAKQIARLQEGFGAVYQFGILASAFFLLRFLAVPLSWATMVLFLLAFWILRALGAAVSVEEPTVRTVVRWRER